MPLPVQKAEEGFQGRSESGSPTLRHDATTKPGASSIPIGNAAFIVASEVMSKFMAMVVRVARHPGTVLIIGETGSGKEMIANSIREHSLRCGKPFVEINCAALPENLVESELFGYEKGAFSGADTAKPGLFELAHTGTVFLDEIGELDLRVQVKLLRVLDRAPYYRLGGHRKITSDVRVVAATNRNLKEEVAAGRFRKDLYHRLSQFELCVPPLRERLKDIAALAEYFLSQHGCGLTFSPDALRTLESYSWPGNVRELQNVVNKAAVFTSGPEISASEVRQELSNAERYDSPWVETPSSPPPLGSLQEMAIRKALESTGGHRGRAAEQLGISRRTLSRKLHEYGLGSARLTEPRPLGSLAADQQRRFRIPVQVPVALHAADGLELNCVTADLSANGLGVEGLTASPGHDDGLQVRFRLPNSESTVELLARPVWVSADGRAGIAFTDVNPAARREITRWLSRQIAKEGWTVQPTEPAEPGVLNHKGRAASAGI